MSHQLCRICNGRLNESLVLPNREPSHAFVKQREAPRHEFELTFASCQACEMIQTVNPIVASVVGRIPPWMTLSEPEQHLDELARLLLEFLPAIDSAAGITQNDNSFMFRLQSAGVETFAIEWPSELLPMLDDTMALQTGLSAKKCSLQPQASLIVCRNFVEHLADPLMGLTNLTALVKPGGHLLLEVPLHESAIANFDYSVLWEQHNLLPTKKAALNLFQLAGDIVGTWTFDSGNSPYLVALVAVGSPNRMKLSQLQGADFGLYRDSVKTIKSRWEEILAISSPIYGFGASHLLFNFLSVLGLEGNILAVIDSNPNKIGLYAPTSRLPIVSTEILSHQSKIVCYHALSNETLTKVETKYSTFLKNGGQLISIRSFPRKY